MDLSVTGLLLFFCILADELRTSNGQRNNGPPILADELRTSNGQRNNGPPIRFVSRQRRNEPPHFLPGGDMTGFSLREDTPAGTSVYTLRGRDPEGTDVTFSVSGDFLSVDRDSGIVTLVQDLDRERITSIETIITVTDGRIFGQEANTVPRRLDIAIIDVNDNDPIFGDTPYFFRMSESASPGATLFSKILISDADAGINSQITLTCVRKDTPEACDVFDVREARTGEGSYIGVISLGSSLDYEKRTSYDIKLMAEDGGGMKSTTTVQVTVEDVQDQPPVLLNAPYSASVQEGSKPGLVVLEIKARDGDLGEPQPLSLSLEGDDSGYFDLTDFFTHEDGTVTASLVTSNVEVDREDPVIAQNGGIYGFNIRAVELGGRKESMRSRVVIVVTDIDDQQPYFNIDEANVTVSENLADGTPLPGLDLIVSDEDVGINAHFSLRLEDVSNSKGIFAVFPEDAVGRTPVIVKVINGSALDFENKNAKQFAFRVVVSQNERAISSALVNVMITDANDNSPIFAYPSYRFSVEEVAEPYTFIANLQANDSDSGNFGHLMYSLKGFGAEKFSVNSSTGDISVAPCGVHSVCLDFEQQTLYSLTYSATDGGRRVTSVNVFVDIVDVNDNAPTFERVEYRRTVDEGTTYFDPPLVVKATDADGKEQGGGRVTYSLRDGNTDDEAFQIGPSSGEILISRPLSHIDTPSSIYVLTIRATDQGRPSKYGDVRVHVTVGRDKNRPPRFSKQMYRTSILENAMPGTEVATVKARDPDGSDSAISYHLGSGGGDHFVLHKRTGEITVARGAVLDRDVEPFYELTVVAVDGGQVTQQSSSAIVNITLNDVNNKPPTFDRTSYVGHINERSSEGDPVLRLTASDPDQNSRLVFDIIDPIFAYDKTGVTLLKTSIYDFRAAFGINKTSGEVLVSGKLNHNDASVIVFNVLVSDLEADKDYPVQNDTTEVTIYVQVFSDKNPIFPSPWTPLKPVIEVNLKEEGPVGRKAFTVAAKDPTTGRSVRRYEKIRDSDPDDVFRLDPLTGQVSLNTKLDYERSHLKKESFEILAIAGDRTSQATVVVHIEDINDNNPQFSQNEYHTRLPEDSRWPKAVLQVTATDADSEERGKVRYSLGGEDKLLFVINETTGQIQVARGAQLDRETTSTVNLQVTAYDTPAGGVSQRKTSVIVKIELLDANDEVPMWTNNGEYTAVVAENTPIGTQVIQVKATDPDLGVNGAVTYQIPELQELKGLFHVDSESGVVTVMQLLNGKGRTAPYELPVRALDGGLPQQFSQAKVTLFIGDVSLNDGVPVFLRPEPNDVATVLENSRVGTAVFQVEAIDADSSDTANGKIIYSFLENHETEGPFQIDASSGLITTQGKLDRELKDQHSVVVVAQDLGRPPQLTSRVLLINVTDADDNDPIFLKLPGKEFTEFEVEEEAAAGTVVGYIKAIDRDVGENALVDYKITYGNEENFYGINRTDDNRGQIYVKGRIDREKTAETYLTVACGKFGHRIPDRVRYRSSDPSLLKVKIKVRDLDDNRPEFEKSVLNAGVREDAPLQTEILKLTARDRDPTALPIRYTLYNASIGFIRDDYELASEEIVDGDEIFLLEETTGILRTKASLRSYSSDIFTLYVEALSNPNDKPALAKISIYVLRDSDLLRFVFNKSPREIRNEIPEFSKLVREALPVPDELNIYDTNYYDDAEGKIDYEKTGSCFQLVGRNLDDTRKLLDASKNLRLKQVFKKFHVSRVEECQLRRLSRTSVDWVEVWVLVIAAMIGAGAAVASCVVCCLYSRYKSGIKKNLHHMRLLDSPQLPPPSGGPPMAPGSIIMLPPPQLFGPPPPVGGAPGGYEWQERAMPVDAISFSSVQR